jgi:two-component system chemotaxis response regulator CheB
VGLVQDPDDALHDSMPRNALEHVTVEHVLPAMHLGKAVSDLVFERLSADHEAGRDPLLDAETAMASVDDVTTNGTGARPSGLACPACHGALFELPGAPEPRYRCRVGHAWSPESLLSQQSEALEGALWMALRALEEKAALSRRMADAARSRGSARTARRLEEASSDTDHASDLIRELIARLGGLTVASNGAGRVTP